MRAALWLSPVLALTLGAQDANPKHMGIQIRGNYPLADLKDQIGIAGAGASIFVESQLEDGYAVRLAGGMDIWGKGLTGGLSGSTRARVFHFDVEGLKFLRPDDQPNLLGPYVVAGVGAYGWEIVENSTKTDSVRWGGSAGFGYRVSPSLDMEIRGMYSYPMPGLSAASLSGGVSLRF